MKMLKPVDLNQQTLPIGKANPRTNSKGVRLLISNLESNLGIVEWRRILLAKFRVFVPDIQQIKVIRPSDVTGNANVSSGGSGYAIVKVPSMKDAQLAISQFNGCQLGNRRIRVSLMSNTATGCYDVGGENNNGSLEKQKKCIAKLLMNAPNHSLPASKLLQLFERKFNRTISLGDLYRMRDVVEFRSSFNRQNERIVILTNRVRMQANSELPPDVESSLCPKHRPTDAQASMHLLNQLRLPRVNISLSELRTNVTQLLEAHDGKLPLPSFLCCYEATFGALQTERCPKPESISMDGQQAQQHETQVGGGGGGEVSSGGSGGSGIKNYVLLEHLLTCVPGLIIQTAPDGPKSLHLQEGQKDATQAGKPTAQSRGKLESAADTAGHPMAVQENVRQLRREVVEMIKQQQPNCELLLTNFISTYHSQFGKQCRVADYGFSRLLDVIDSLNNVVHIVGSGALRTLMLTHGIQLRRFTHDVLRVLKSEPKKSCPVSQFATMYEQVFRKEFIASNYGVCDLNDLLNDMPENIITVDRTKSQEPTIVIPRRIQTAEQRFRTILFGIEVVEMLRRLQRFQIQFNKFIPAYHHAFYRQCRVSEYGFVKLIELLEALPHVVQVIEEAGEKYITLTNKFRLAIVREMIMSLLEKQPSNRLPLDELETTLLANHRPALIPGDLGFASLRELLASFPFVQILRLPTAVSSPSASKQLREWQQADVLDDEGQAEGSGDNSDQTVIGEYAHKGAEKVELAVVATAASTGGETEVEKDGYEEAEDCHASTPSGFERPRDILCLTDRSHIKQLAYRCLQLLFGSPFCSLQEAEFKRRFVQSFNEEVDLDCVKREMSDFIQVTDYDPVQAPNSVSEQCVGESSQGPVPHSSGELRGGIPGIIASTTENVSITTSTQIIALTPIIVFARQLRTLLLRTRGRMMLALLETIYHSTFGLPLRPEAYGYPSIATLVGAVSFIAVIRGRGARATLFLAQDYLGRLAWRVAYKVPFRHELHWPASVCGLLRPEFLQMIGRDRYVNAGHQMPSSDSSCFPSCAKPTNYSQHQHPVGIAPVALEPSNQALPYSLNGMLPVGGAVSVESVPSGLSDPPQIPNYVSPLFLPNPLGDLSISQQPPTTAFNFPPAPPTAMPYFISVNQPTPGMYNFCPPNCYSYPAVHTAPMTKELVPFTTLPPPSCGSATAAASLVNFPLEPTSPTVTTNGLPTPVGAASFTGLYTTTTTPTATAAATTSTTNKVPPSTPSNIWSQYDQTAGTLPPKNPQPQPSPPTTYGYMPPFCFRPLPLIPEVSKALPTLQPMPSPAPQLPTQQTPSVAYYSLCPPNMPLVEMVPTEQNPVDQTGEKVESERCPVQLPSAATGCTWHDTFLPYYTPTSVGYYPQLSLQGTELRGEGCCSSAGVLEHGGLETGVSMDNETPPSPPPPPPRPAENKWATMAAIKADYQAPDMLWHLQASWPYSQILSAMPAPVETTDVPTGSALGSIYPCRASAEGPTPVPATSVAPSQQPVGISSTPPRNRCEEGDWTLPISVTTESYDSNSKELDDSGSLD
uniref:Meiosis arrest female protein 1 n=1 Tax=Schistocephalus solidus TaxID=70667 RepID=A0A0X3PJ73_SCHSO